MLSIPSARRYLGPALTVLVLLIFVRLLSQHGLVRSSQSALLQGVLQSYVARSSQVVVVVSATSSAHRHLLAAGSMGIEEHLGDRMVPLANPLIVQFTHCPIQPNPHTSHIRLPNVLYNISLKSPEAPLSGRHQKRNDVRDDGAQGMENTRFFNPAIIPLPYWSGLAKYVLVSRLVTTGYHQESHICLADVCHPPHTARSSSPSTSFQLERGNNATHPHDDPDLDPSPYLEKRQPRSRQALPPDTTSPCSPSDLSDTRLGSRGGLRCVSNPVKINIPSTPAENCTGSWLAFPDIPGFHDPRVFWSGKGEPLILVNSASRYGCVGLWVIDLRQVYPELERVLNREHRHKAMGIGMEAGGPKLETRDDAETGMEMEMEMRDDQARTGTLGGLGLKPLMSYPHLTEITRNPRESRARVEKNWMLWFPTADEAYVQYDLLSQDAGEAEDENGFEQEEVEMLARLGLNATTTAAAADALLRPSNNATNLTSSSSSAHHAKLRRWRNEEAEHTRKGGRGRTFAKLTGNGFTTPNLTSALEQPCFSHSEGHFTDSVGNMGHWHQGSNSLRLILCTRAQARSDSVCKDDDDGDIPAAANNGTAVTAGRSVHFAIMHRKFSNELDLPLRYERYAVVWEGREPFQILGVSRFPLLMNNEKAGPWTEEQNWPSSKKRGWNSTAKGEYLQETKERRRIVRTRDDGEDWYENDEAEQTTHDNFVKSDAYFTYTPSLAWAWRPHSVAANQEEEDDDVEYMSQLGTGYLGDDVLVGIGLEDVDQAFARVKVDDLLQCLRLCPGVKFADEPS